MPLFIDPQSVTVRGRLRNPPHTAPLPLLPLLVGCPAFIDHKSTSLAALIVNHPRWHYWSAGPSAVGLPSAHIAGRLWPIDPLRYSIEGSLLIIHLFCCNFIFFPVHTVVTGSPFGGNLVNKHTAFVLSSPCYSNWCGLFEAHCANAIINFAVDGSLRG